MKIYQKHRNMIKFINLKKYFSFEQTKDKFQRHFMLYYSFVEDIHYKRIPYRDDHLKLVEQYENQGNIIIGGNFFPNDGACFFFTALDEISIDNFVKKDPYFKKGLITKYEIKEIELHTKKRADELALYYKYR